MNATQSFVLSKKYTDDSMAGGGSVRGKNCVVKSITDITGGHRVTFQWTLDNGTVQTGTMDVMDGTNTQLDTMPVAGSTYAGQIRQYTGATTAQYTQGYFYYCQEDATVTPHTYSWVNIPVQESSGGDSIQVETLPTAEASLLGTIFEYVGATTSTLTNGYFYQCILDGSSYKWVEKKVQAGGSGGSSELENAINATVDVGGVSAGDTFAAGTSLESVLRAILSPTIYPTFTAPSASLTYSASSYYAVGSNVAALTATVGYNAGAIMLDGVKQNNRGGAATQYAIATTGADTEYSDTSSSSGSFSVPQLTRATKGTIKVTGTVSYAQGPQPKDSSGADYSTPLAAGSVASEKTLNFIQPYYYGVSNSPTISDFTGLTENVTAKGNKTFNFTTANQHMVFAYDSSYGNLKSILDPNGFETISGWTKSTLTVGGFSYFVYVANSATTDTGAAFTFKY